MRLIVMVSKRVMAMALSLVMMICIEIFPNCTLSVKAIDTSSNFDEFKNYCSQSWTAPITVSYAKGAFNAKRTASDGSIRSHAGIDWVCSAGTPVYAMTGGTVVSISRNFYLGTDAIEVLNIDGSVSRYCEIEPLVSSGTYITKGQQIANVKKSTSGSHMLHLELYRGTASGALTQIGNTNYYYAPAPAYGGTYSRRSDLLDTTFLYSLSSEPTPTSAPTWAQLSKNQIWYDLKDTIVLTPSSDTATSYWIAITKGGNMVINTQIFGDYSISANDLGGLGDYYAWITAVNSNGTVDSNGINFSIVGSATYTGVHSDKSIYNINETVSITVDTVCAKGQVIGIDKENVGRVITENCDTTYTIEASKLGIGVYSAYFSVYNGSGGIDTKRIEFSITNFTQKPEYLGESFSAKIVNKDSGLYVTNKGYSVGCTALNNQFNQLWVFKRHPDGSYSIISRSNSALTLDVDNYGLSGDGTDIHVYTINETSEQRFYIYTISGAYYIKPVCTDKVLDMDGTTKKLQIYSFGENWTPQMFDIVKTEVSNLGDINLDGSITSSDLIILKNYVLMKSILTNEQLMYADLNQDGKINSIDIIGLKQLIIVR